MKTKVVIVGAGVSGLSGAQYLCQNGRCDVTILEAENYIGGRLRTIDFHGHTIDLGAQWIHGDKGHSLYELLSKKLGSNQLVKMQEVYKTGDDNLSVVFASGRRVTPEVAALYENVEVTPEWLSLAMEEITNKEEPKEEDLMQITADVLMKRVWDSTLAKNDTYRKLNVIDKKAFYKATRAVLYEEFGAEAKEISCLQFRCYERDQGSNYILPAGFGTFVDLLAESIPQAAFKLNCKVKSITWQRSSDYDATETTREKEKKQIVVNYVNEKQKVLSLVADHVIVTLSVGCLQKHHKTLFAPNLSPRKELALGKMRIGCVNKVLLYFKSTVWPQPFGVFFLWDSYEGKDEFADPDHWCRNIRHVSSYKGSFLITWINKIASEKTANLSNKEMGKTVIDLVRKVKDDVPIPYPDDVIRTDWGANENFLGSYSYIGLGVTSETKNIFREPLFADGVPRVLFAGEATDATRFGTVDGARETGIREARRILRHCESG